MRHCCMIIYQEPLPFELRGGSMRLSLWTTDTNRLWVRSGYEAQRGRALHT